jgi:hypothetical protein
MRNSLMSISASALALAMFSDLAPAQTVQSALPTPPVTAPVAYDPQQFPAIRGELERLTLTGRGDVDGLILKDGTEVKTTPSLSTQIASLIKPGDHLTIHGLKAAALPLVRAVSVTEEGTKRTVTDAGMLAAPPPHPVPPKDQAPQARSEVSGKVRMALHGPQGEVDGVLLDSGTFVRFAPDQAMHLTALVQPGQSLVAQGDTVTNSFGTSMTAQLLGPSRDRLAAVAPMPRPMDDRGPASRGPRPRPEAGPPAPPAAPPPAG